jgi:hypothetical protein|tara:strand:+ start:68 stop:295 length:228 start_codon:yes stop_codon:yes gene_type:complete
MKYCIIIFEATHREPVCTIVVVRVGYCAIEVKVTGISATYRTRPIVAVCTLIVKRTIGTITVTRRGNKHKLTHSN